jgi:hypothetical protein
MDNPVTIVKSNLTVGKVVGFIVLGIVVFAIGDLTGLTGWFLAPVTSFKNWNAARTAK